MSNFLMIAIVIMIATVIVVVMVVMVVMDRTGQDKPGRDGTGQNCHLNLTFQVTCDWLFGNSCDVL